MIEPIDETRRQLLHYGFYGIGLLAVGPALYGCQSACLNGATDALANIGPLGAPNADGLRLPPGFSSRIVARSSQVVPGSGYSWHAAPDGGATFAASDGGWVYVSNSEISQSGGGVSALRFNAVGALVAAYPILSGTSRNCAGGPTPWGTWLSCEEVERGRVWECDPFGTAVPAVHPALGVFNHEAVAVDPLHKHLYLTEDEDLGRFYRFTPQRWQGNRPELATGILEAAQVMGSKEGSVVWHRIPDPQYSGDLATRFQAPETTIFDGGEGCWYHKGIVYFTTKGTNQVWAYDTAQQDMRVIYDTPLCENPVLTGVDNITVNSSGNLLVAEDGGNMQVVVLTPSGHTAPLLQVVDHPASEITGPALSPDGKRLYFSSQRGNTGRSEDGVTYEVTFPM